MGSLFETSVANINIHLKNIFEEGELSEAATLKESLRVAQEGKRTVNRKVKPHNLECILAVVGYRA